MTKLSVIIPVYNDPDNLGKCLDSLERSRMKEFQLIVVDDGSDVSCEQVAADRCDEFIRQEVNGGQSAARNLGAGRATADFLFFLDSDIMVEPDTLDQVLREFEQHPDIAGLFCSFQHDTPARNFFSQFKNLQHHFTHQVSRREAVTFCGGFGAIRREVFTGVGGFQEDLRFMEDVEMGYRLHKAGHRILLCPAIQLTHNKRYSLVSLIRSDLFQRAIPWTRIMLERRVYRNDLNTSSNNVASVIVVFLMLAALLFQPGGVAGLVAVESLLLLTLVLLNRPFLSYVWKMRGVGFAVLTVAMIWLQYAYSGLGFLLGVLAHYRARLASPGHD
jgi:GT2 family glycosyltransferase